jgi:MFS family permease
MRHFRSGVIPLWLTGALAAAQLAKFASLAPLLRESHHLSLAATGLLISLLEVGGALFGFVAGLALSRIGTRSLLLAGLALLAITGAVEAFAADTTILFVARAAEGIAYLFVVISAPTLIFAVAEERDRPFALALWSTFVPVGMAIGSAISGQSTALVGLKGTMLLWSVLCAIGLLVMARLPIAAGKGGGRIAMPRIGAWFATLGFGFYTIFVCALSGMLPTFLVERMGASIGGAGVAAAVVSMAALLGFVIALSLIRRGVLGNWRLNAALLVSLLATAAAAPFIFSSGGLIASVVVAFLVITLSGVASPLVFARLPMLAGAGSSHDPRIAAANGLLTQFGAGGALLGPPLGGLIAARWGWDYLGLAISLLAVAMLGALLAAERSSGQRFS